MKRTIYCYHKESENINRIILGQNPLYKIGDTTRDNNSTEKAVLDRIDEQDTTETSEPLIMDFYYKVPDSFMPDVEHVDRLFHKWLEKFNIYKYRKDKDREWFDAFRNTDEIKAFLNLFFYGIKKPNNYSMRASQQAAHDKMVKYFTSGDGEFLLAAKMRFGKNFTFLNVIKTLNYKNVLVLTYRPNVFDSLNDDIDNHIYFDNFNYILYKNIRENLILSSNKVNVVACSAQMAGYKYNEETDEVSGSIDKKNLKKLSEFKWDLIVTDECHYGTNTINFKEICNELKCPNILYISGTPFKTLANFSNDALFMYTYVDEQNDPDAKLAKLHQYGIEMDKKLIAYYKKYCEIAEYPTMTKIFNADCNGNFEYPEVAREMLDIILTKDIKRCPDNIDHMFVLLDHKNSCKACTKYINEQYSDTFLGIDASNNIHDVNGLKKEMHYGIKDNKKTITFSCGRFIEGTSIPEWNCVIMLHDGQSPERYFQSMFRGQTPAEWKYDFYVIDYNPNRMLCMNHYMINELPTGAKSITGNTKMENIKAWLKAAPIITINNDNEYTDVDYNAIENVFFHNSRIGANKMTDTSVFNRLQFINITNNELTDIMNNKGKMSVNNLDSAIVTNNDLGGGKNKVSKTDDKRESKTKTNKNNKEYTLSELVAFAKEICKFLPRYIGAYTCKSFDEIIKTCKENTDDNQELFSIYTNVDFNIFERIVNANVINEDGINNVINNFWEEFDTVMKMDAIAQHNFKLMWNIFK